MEHTPVFVKIDQYKELAQVLGAIREKIEESSSLLNQLEKLKTEEDAQLKAWAASLEEVRARTGELSETFARK